MIKFILILCMAFSLNANAESSNIRNEIGSSLNDMVLELKDLFSTSEEELTQSLEDSEELKKTANDLKQRSEEAEVNPKVLRHGKVAIDSSCDYDKQNLQWVDGRWTCVNAAVTTGCEAAASDEYAYSDNDGKTICSKSPEGQSLNYNWVFRGYSNRCIGAHEGFDKLYDCVYKNKQGGSIQVADSNCSKLKKPDINKKACYGAWVVSEWGRCSVRCGHGGTTRTISCQAGYDCSKTPKPILSKNCYLRSCAYKTKEYVESCYYGFPPEGCGASGSLSGCSKKVKICRKVLKNVTKYMNPAWP